MANGIYFDLYRDDTSDSTSSPDESQQLSIVLDQDRQSASSSSIYSVIGKAFGALKLQGSGMFRYNNTDTESNLNDPTPILRTPDVRVFSLAELKNATKNFKSDRVLDEGVYGKVFKGLIDDKNHPNCSREYFVAIKKLNSKSIQGTGGCQQYEVNSFGRHYHKNIVRLLGYCLEDKELLLVYEFMPKGSFENHLFRNVQLAWNLRIKIVLGAARGLAFLHSVDKTVIYREFRTSNILLDGDYNAKLSDFGLAKNDPLLGYSHLTTPVMGTYGYAAPEYVAKGHLCVKSDVYGFGVVLLEVLTGLRAVDTNRPTGQHNLVDWLKPSLSYRRKLPGIMDPTLKNQCSAQAATQAATLTLKCLSTKPGLRPSMEEVVQCLEGIQLM